MSTFTELSTGDAFTTPARPVDPDLAATLVRAGGYTHPLFTDPDYAAASRFGASPIPGEGLLLLMGGLVEQSERFDETTIALIGFDEVTFAAPAFAGDTLSVAVEVLEKHPHPNGERGTITFRWTCRNGDGVDLVVATARLLFRLTR